MAEDPCLIQYVRDNFCEEYVVHNYVNIADDGDDGDDTYCLDFNLFTESSTFDHSPATADASTPFVPDLFSSLSPCTELPAAMESTAHRHGCSSYSPDAAPGLESLSGPFPTNLQPFDRPLPIKENEYPMLAAYIGNLSQANTQLEDFTLQGSHIKTPAGFEGNSITLDEMLQEQSAANCTVTSITSGNTSSSSFWRGKSPALLMQELKGPSPSASSSSSEARTSIKPPSAAPNPTLGPRIPLNLTTLTNRDYRTAGDIKGANLSVQPTLSKSAPTFSGQRFLPPLGSDVNIDSTKFNVSSGSVGQGHRILRSSSFDPQLIASKGDIEMQATSTMDYLKLGRKTMPSLALWGEMHRNAASGNNSWSSSSTSPTRNIDSSQDIEVAASPVHKLNYSALSVDREMVGGDRVWKKAKGDPGSTSSEGGAVQTTVNIATAMVEQREKSQLQAKFLALLQTDSSTSKVDI